MGTIVKYSVLFVDDDEKIVNSFKRTIRNKDIKIFIAHNGEEALKILQNEKIEVLITDIRMPKMSGIDLLTTTADSHPEIIRIAISGDADKDDIKQLINRGHIWQYIEKPFNMGFLFVTIKNALELYLEREERINLIQKLDRKSKELEELNIRLEEKVAERTKLLSIRSNILHMILDGNATDDIFTVTGQAICQSSNVDNIHIHSPLLHKPFSMATLPDNSSIENKVKEVFKTHTIKKSDSVLCYPLLQHDEIVGVLCAHCTNTNTDSQEKNLDEILDFFSPLITMSLSHKKLLNDLPDLMSEIESVIGTFEDEQ